MLSSGAGTIVPFGDPAALAEAVCGLIDHPEQLAAARREARRVGAALAWPSVAEATAAVLEEAAAAAPRRTPIPDVGLSSQRRAPSICSRSSTTAASCSTRAARSPTVTRGYCVDDLARLVVVALELESRTGDSKWTPSSTGRSRFSTTRPTRTAPACATS